MVEEQDGPRLIVGLSDIDAQVRRDMEYAHDLSVARKVSDRVMIMRQGELAGIGPVREALDAAQDPYIQKLAASVFTFDGRA